MCVIAVQNKNQPILTYDEISAMCNHNPHGIGLMWNDGKQCHYKKGYFDVDSFYNDYVALKNNKKIGDIALHMRIATGSNIDVANCHPFPITSVKKRIKSSHGTADVCIMMNGIIGDSTKELSDTAIYTMTNLKSYYDTDSRFYKHFTRQQQILFDNEISGCKFAFMDKDSCDLLGYGWSSYEGKAEVSNRYWIPKKLSDYNYYSNLWDYLDSYDYDDLWVDRRSTRFATKKKDKRHKSYIDYLNEAVI
jgi:hypothetical protein